jgi:cysteine desulfurase family protein (TIGR01976 family)
MTGLRPTTGSRVERFPSVGRDGWARFDGPAGTQLVDVAVDAMVALLTNGSSACGGGTFAASMASDAVQAGARAAVGDVLHAPAECIWFGPNMTTMTLAFTRALAREWRPGDRIVCTQLDHDADVTSWRAAAEDRGAEVVVAPMDPRTGRLPTESVLQLLDERVRWVAVCGASNLLGSMPDLPAISRAVHAAGARLFVDAVALAVHRAVDVGLIGCDALVTSAYKWYGPHAAAMYVEPALLRDIRPYKLKASGDDGPGRLETGMPSYEALTGVRAAARFLLEEGMEDVAAAEETVFAPLLEGLLAIPGVTVWGPHDLVDRVPTVAFTIDGWEPGAVARELAGRQIAVWSGHNYALGPVEALGLADRGGVVRAGVVRYVTHDDVARLLRAVERLASTRGS